MEVLVNIENYNHANLLKQWKLNGDHYEENTMILYLVPEELNLLIKEGFSYEIKIHDLNKHYLNYWDHRDDYHSYSEIIALADSLALHFPSICFKQVLGTSMEGREIGALKISDNVSEDEHEAEVLFDAGIHGDESIGPEIAIRFARMLCLQYNNDPSITDLINDREIWIYYMVNPDGRANMSRYNHNGVDLNRDCGYMWDQWGGSTGAYSQIESKILRDFVLSHQFVIHTTYHSGTEFVSYPWSYRPDDTPDESHIDFLAALYSSSSNYPVLDYGQGFSGMYDINGSTKDSNYGIMGSVSWSMEISYVKQPPTSEISNYYNYNEPAMLEMIEQAGYGIKGMLSDAITGEPVAGMVFFDNGFPCFSDPQYGDYHKFIIPGTYSVKVTANGYESTSVENIIVSNENCTVVDIQLQPQEGHYAYRTISSRIPGNNFADEGDTRAFTGAPDNINYSTGQSGWIVIDMQYPIVDGPGDDITLFEGDDTPEGYTLFISQSMDGPWIELGTGEGTTSFDIYNMATPGSQYLKISDDGNGPGNVDNAGFDLDAIMIHPAPAQPSNPNPSSGQNNLDPFLTISWEAGYGGSPTWYKVYFGTDNPPTNIIDGDSTTSTSYELPVLDFETSYYWCIEAGNYGGSTMGEVWSFNTNQAPDEYFETGDYSLHNWQFSGDAVWSIDDENMFFGNYVAQSGTIGDNQSSSLSITLDVETYFSTYISFRKKTSSALNDKLQFLIDGEIMDEWSGMGLYSKEFYPVTEGLHTFEWKYIKNENATAGDDCAWIDYIYFPTLAPPTVNAGNDTAVCAGESMQLSGFATNYNSVIWETSGDGSFNDNVILNPLYTPGFDDIQSGSVTLTLTVTAGEELLTDLVELLIENPPATPQEPSGPDYVDLFYQQESTFEILSVPAATGYNWQLIPVDAGTMSGIDTTLIVQWNDTFEGTAQIQAKAFNNCGESDWSIEKNIQVYNSVGYTKLLSGEDHCIIYPNPTLGECTIEINIEKSQPVEIKVSDMMGAVLKQYSLSASGGTNNYFLNLESLVPGLYIITVNTENKLVNFHIVRI